MWSLEIRNELWTEGICIEMVKSRSRERILESTGTEERRLSRKDRKPGEKSGVYGFTEKKGREQSEKDKVVEVKY